jgi:hypothetical protein
VSFNTCFMSLAYDPQMEWSTLWLINHLLNALTITSVYRNSNKHVQIVVYNQKKTFLVNWILDKCNRVLTRCSLLVVIL